MPVVVGGNTAPVGTNQNDLWVRGTDNTVWLNTGPGFTAQLALLNGAQAWNGNQTITGTASATVGTLKAINSNASAVGMSAMLSNLSANNVANAVELGFSMNNSTPSEVQFGAIRVTSSTVTAAAEAGTMIFRTMVAGTMTTALTLATGVTVTNGLTISTGNISNTGSYSGTGDGTFGSTAGGTTTMTIGGGAGTVSAINASSSGAAANLYLQPKGAGDVRAIWSQGTGDFVVGAGDNATVRFRVASATGLTTISGNVGIGVTANEALHVNGSVKIVGALATVNGSYADIDYNTSSGLTRFLSFGKDNATMGLFQWYQATSVNGGGVNTSMALGATGGLQLYASGGTAPTGGDKGQGTANFAADIYKNNAAYTNPDYVFEHFYTGAITKYADKPGAASYGGLRSLSDLEAYVREHYCFPGFGQQSDIGLFEGGDNLLLITEELALHVIDADKRIKMLEAKFAV